MRKMRFIELVNYSLLTISDLAAIYLADQEKYIVIKGRVIPNSTIFSKYSFKKHIIHLCDSPVIVDSRIVVDSDIELYLSKAIDIPDDLLIYPPTKYYNTGNFYDRIIKYIGSVRKVDDQNVD